MRIWKASPLWALFTTLVVLSIAPAARASNCSSQPVWSSYSPSSPPAARWYARAIWDSLNARMIVFGGNSSSTNYTDVWSYSPSSGTWTQLSPSGTAPSGQNKPSAIYDPVRQRMVVYGQSDVVYALSLGGSPAWSQISTSGTSPGGMVRHVAVYDRHRDQMVVVDPLGPTYRLAFSNNTWSSLDSHDTGATLGGMAGIYDPVNQRVIVFGGCAQAYGSGVPVGIFNDVLSLPLNVGTPTWSDIGDGQRIYDAQAIFDPQCSRMIVHGGTLAGTTPGQCNGQAQDDSYTGKIWSVTLPSSGSPVWTELTPTGTTPDARSHHGGAYDPASNKFYIFGGGTSGSTCVYRNDLYSMTLPDVTHPAPTTNLSASPTCESIYLSWQSSGDDVNRHRAYVWEVWAASFPLNDTNYASGTLVGYGTPGVPGTWESTTHYVGSCSQAKYYAAVTGDEQGNHGSVSATSYAYATPCPPPQCMDAARGLSVKTALRLQNPFPNPASGAVEIQYSLPSQESATLRVFDLSGRQVADLGSEGAGLRPGAHTFEWKLVGADGRPLPTGTYFVRLRVGEDALTRTVVVR